MRQSLFLLFLPLLISSVKNLPAQEISNGKQQYAFIGDLNLVNGKKIYDCTIGYRTYGKLNADKSNAIIFPTWFTGTTKDLEAIVPGKMIDTNFYYLILFDALGDGYSSSPSNSKKQSRLEFPVFTTQDMVESQYRVLTEKMNIHHLVAVAGISMGGMQSFQWAVSHPEFMDKVIPIVGTPQLTSNDLLLWSGELSAIERDTAYHGGNYSNTPALPTVIIMHQLALTTPEYESGTISRDSFSRWFPTIESNKNFDWNNRHRQLEAMNSHDITKTTNGTLDEAAIRIKPKMLIIVSRQDHMVNPGPAIRFAQTAKAQLLILESNCGHRAVLCEQEKITVAIHDFLKN
jgi:homoserine O-acetyltransferase